MKKLILLLPFFSLACATAHYVHPTKTAADLAGDQLECKAVSLGIRNLTYDGSGNGFNDLAASIEQVKAEKQCMKSLGWSKVK